jgi:hypothetical protein
MKSFKELRVINVNEHIEKKNNLSYLSWAWAVDTLMQNDPMAYWEFKEPMSFGETLMVFCEVHAFGKTIKMHLPVLDYRNKAIPNPDAFQVSNTMMRCLTKAIACFGIGLYIYAGEDLPNEDESTSNPHAAKNMQPSDEEAGAGFSHDGTYRLPFGTDKGRTIAQIAELRGIEKLKSNVYLTETRVKDGKPYAGCTIDQMLTFINEASDYIIKFENPEAVKGF